MNRFRHGMLVAFAAIAVVAAFAQSAAATPSKTSPCTSCHSGVNVPVTATLTSITSAAAVYTVSAPGATVIAMFSGTTKLSQVTGTSGKFTVAPGKTYTIFAVKGPSTSSGIGQTSVSPVAPADTTAPVTSSNAVASYTGTATITLSAADTGGSGVAHTYYKLDGGAQVEAKTIVVSTVGAHAIEFWSVDGAGNEELPHKRVTFVIDTTAPTTTSNARAFYTGPAAISLTAADGTGSGVAHTYYRLDGGAQTEGTSMSLGTEGAHTIEFWSTDAAGNTEQPHKSAGFTIDLTAPRTTSNVQALYTARATITFSATGVDGGVCSTYHSLDGAAPVKSTSVTVSALGAHTVEFWSTDAFGNEENPRQRATFRIRPIATKVTLTRTPTASRITRYRRAGVARYTLSAKVRGSNGVRPGVRVLLQMRDSSTAKWESMYSFTSNASGNVSKTFVKRRRFASYYRWYVPATEANLTAATSSQRVVVK